MKKLLLLITIILLQSCGNLAYDEDEGTVYKTPIFDYRIITIDSCEYIINAPEHTRALTHKGNCKNKIHKLP